MKDPILRAWRHPHFGIRRVLDICLLYVVACVASALLQGIMEPLAVGMGSPLLGVIPGAYTHWLVSGVVLTVAAILIAWKSLK